MCIRDRNYIEAETINVERYLQSSGIDDDIEISNTKIPFLRWLLSNAVFKNNSVLISLSNYVERMQMITVGSGMRFLAGKMCIRDRVYTTNEAFVAKVAASICSVFENNKEIDEIRVFIVGQGISKESKNKFLELADKYNSCLLYTS